ncbi:hypothetical protein JoomaDRAFT_3803 [Galbibacter orientalis DSM 19592]|uniref:PKD domain-containing protein n=1 Tax=Galbibacter orientalis DSM 19592 TaxID=926559 RepID=I3CAU0_9FLAO|nr:hypothetical protein [Galbibacter orientalis]EIJ40733.1 hypothetical protein JoomaDRAFT_3803 [Galbibacter orientalis DSM 19592]
MKPIFIDKIYWFIAFSFLFITACSDDDKIELIEPSQRVIFTSEMDFENKIEVNSEMSFGDVSAGVASRTWTFPEGVADILNSENDNTSAEENLKVRFRKTGKHNVKLHQTFKKDAYVGTTLKGKELDTTIVVTVLSPVTANIKANYINKDGSIGAALKIQNNAENEVTASRSVQFTYVIEGEPEAFLWEFEGGDPAAFEGTDENLAVKYKKQGVYDVSFVASRERPFGGDTLTLKNLIKVIPSTDPVELESVTSKNGNIALVYSREMDGATLNATDFSITLENGETILSPTISTISIDDEEGNIVLLSLGNEQIYNDDIIKVSYTAGVMATLDGVLADNFTEEQVIFNKVNILKESSEFDYSFESFTATNWPYMSWGAPWDAYTLEISGAQAQDGNKSAYVEINPGGGMIVGHKDNSGNEITFPVEAGKTYEIGVWVYVTNLGNIDPSGFDPDLRFFWFPDTDWAVVGNPTFSSNFTVGEWVYSATFVEFSQSGDKTFQIRGANEANAQTLSFYMDNISVSEASLRP